MEAFGHGLLLLLRHRAPAGSGSEDLYQDTLRLAIAKIRQGELRDPEKLPAFLASIARNLAIHHHRMAARRQVSGIEPAAEFPHPDPGPLDLVLAAERRALVAEVLNGLTSQRDREVLRRFYLTDEDRPAICDRFGLTLPDLNRVLHRARLRFRRLYEAAVQTKSSPGDIFKGDGSQSE